ncbi:hypothetical protein Dfulv_46680 [Dactylosporangium fulvum]|uniref:Transposase IS701-like DDE domain-containing protein n=1 Tax=Dactylosporangium fulvum TaxID=53359 RepID=A0ABY5VXU6_9ACTN|nr:hypothetical protein [Dactylosporangium fulvum]UWP82450.1 hypothetical protein Dfulv_46680 [Dactylosporangium fulvum]
MRALGRAGPDRSLYPDHAIAPSVALPGTLEALAAVREAGGPGTKGVWLARRWLMAIDVAGTPADVERFGRMGSGPKASAYQKLHVAALAECGSHAIVGAVLGLVPYRGTSMPRGRCPG